MKEETEVESRSKLLGKGERRGEIAGTPSFVKTIATLSARDFAVGKEEIKMCVEIKVSISLLSKNVGDKFVAPSLPPLTFYSQKADQSSHRVQCLSCKSWRTSLGATLTGTFLSLPSQTRS